MKKLLALVLAMVMTLGLATVGAGAAYSDAADIDYKEAVDITTALEIFEGDTSGAFNPDDILTREMGAKLIAYMILRKTAADSLTTAKSSFSDVPATKWSAGSIEYCVSENIISGSDGKFNPTGELTGYAFAKMCLIALGYDPSLEGYVGVGRDWAINVAKDAIEAGLNANLDDLVMSQGITRQQAAQMVLNTLKADLVTYDNGVNISTSDGTKVTVDADLQYYLEAPYTDYSTASEGDGVRQFVEQYYPKLKLDSTLTDDFGRPANTWYLGQSKIGAYGDEADFVYTTGVKGGELYAALNKEAIVNVYSEDGDANALGEIAVYLDGEASAYQAAEIAKIVNANPQVVYPTGAGVKTEVFFSKVDKTLTIVSTHVYLAKATADYDATKEILRVAVDNGSGDTTNNSVQSYITSISGKDFPVVEGVKKGTYLYITVAGSTTNMAVKTVALVPASAFVTNVTASAYTGSTITFDGTTYTRARQLLRSAARNAAFGGANPSLQGSSYDLVLDPYGNILSASVNTDKATPENTYVWMSAWAASTVAPRARHFHGRHEQGH